MAFLAPLVEVAAEGGAAEAAGGAAEAGGEGGGLLGKLKGNPASATQQPGRQNQGASRMQSFMSGISGIRNVLRPGMD